MAREVKVITTVTSDLSGELVSIGDDYEPVVFAVGARLYELDLTDAERKVFGEMLAPYIEAAPEVRAFTAPRKAQASSTTAKRDPQAAAIRSWAQANGWKIPDKGRIPGDVRAAYNEHKGSAPVTPLSPAQAFAAQLEADTPRIDIPEVEPETPSLLDEKPAPGPQREKVRISGTRNPDGSPAGE